MNPVKHVYLPAVLTAAFAVSGLIIANSAGETTASPDTFKRCPYPAAECTRIRKEHKELQEEVARLKKELVLEKRLATNQEEKVNKIEKKLREGRETMLRALRKGMKEDELKQLLGRADDIKTDSVGGVWLIYLYTGSDKREHKYRVHLDKSKQVDLWIKVK